MMRSSNFVARVVTVGTAAALLVGCGGAQSPVGAPVGSSSENVAAPHVQPATGTYDVLYSFGSSGGRHPAAGVVSDGSTLYGTTPIGGTRNKACYDGCGTVFALTTTGTRTTIHRFVGGTSDGQNPASGLTNVSGTLYGTTAAGGSGACGSGCGTVFSITTSGTETILHSFAGGSTDGVGPRAALINVNGTLYGTTGSGGTYNHGTIFSISTSGTETVLHSFAGEPNDGSSPSGPLVDIGGTLYGATGSGGANDLGTVFSVTPSGTETVLYSFKGGKSDGAGPASLVAVDGTLFGATYEGGAPCRTPSNGCGIFFKMITTGTETVLHSFIRTEGTKTKTLTTAGSAIYGTAYMGGNPDKGTLFEISTKGALTVLHTFPSRVSNGRDGKRPVGELLVSKGTIYGVTQKGGSSNKGAVYALTL